MEIRIKVEVIDNDEVVYESIKTSGSFQPEPHYDRMFMAQLAEVMQIHRSNLKATGWFERLKSMRGG